jgi:hypothetical protein
MTPRTKTPDIITLSIINNGHNDTSIMTHKGAMNYRESEEYFNLAWFISV